MAYLTLGSSGGPIDWSSAAPGFGDFYRRMWAREVDLTDKDVKIAFGRIHWERLLQNVRQPRYSESLRLVSERRGA
jgi:hypothetical protein